MNIDFGTSGLETAETAQAGKLKYPISAIFSLRKKLVLLRSAPDERTLRNWKSLHYEKLQGDRSHQRSIRLNKQWRMIFELRDKPLTILIISIEDYH